MKSSNFSSEKIFIPILIQEITTDHLRLCGENDAEGFVAWSGTQQGNEIKITRVLIPPTSEFGHFGGVSISDSALDSFSRTMIEHKEVLIAQVHSHPYRAFHSKIDDNFPLIHRTSFISIVVPFFAKAGFRGCRVYEYISNCRWIEHRGIGLARKIEFEGKDKW